MFLKTSSFSAPLKLRIGTYTKYNACVGIFSKVLRYIIDYLMWMPKDP